MKFVDLMFKEYDFYGTSQLRFKLDGQVWKAIPTDDFVVEELEPVPEGAFFAEPLARVRVELDNTDEFTRWELVDINGGHCWLRFGCNDSGERSRWQFDFFFVQKQRT